MRSLFFEDIIDTEKFSGHVWGLGDSCMPIRKVEESPYGPQDFQRTFSAESWTPFSYSFKNLIYMKYHIQPYLYRIQLFEVCSRTLFLSVKILINYVMNGENVWSSNILDILDVKITDSRCNFRVQMIKNFVVSYF